MRTELVELLRGCLPLVSSCHFDSDFDSSISTRNPKPILRWAGGKQWIAAKLAKSLPAYIGTYYEPFFGGGALFFAARPKRAVLSDINSRLIEAYQVIRSKPQEFLRILKQWPNERDTYYRIRSREYSSRVCRAAQFVYLNRTCWNGLYRVNKNGYFNVPFGNHGRTVCDPDHLIEVSAALRAAEVECRDFARVLTRAGEGDFAYLDPPYVSPESDNGFKRYNERVFSWQDQQRLGRVAVELAERGCVVLVSNASCDEVVKLYPGFSHLAVSRHSVLAAHPAHRQVTSELLFASDPGMLRTIQALAGGVTFGTET